MHDRVDPARRPARRRGTPRLIGAGLVVLGGRHGRRPRRARSAPLERAVFRRRQRPSRRRSARSSGRCCSWAPCSPPRIVALVALLARRPRLAVAALVVGVAKLVAERLVKALVSRQRPWTSIGPDIHATATCHLTGESFVSGHAMLAAALAVVVTPYLVGRWRVVPAALAVAGGAGSGLRRRPCPAGRTLRSSPWGGGRRRRRSARPPAWRIATRGGPGMSIVTPAPGRPAPPTGGRRRRPTGAPPPLPRQIGASGRVFIAGALIMTVWVVLFADDRLGQRAHRAGRRRRAARLRPDPRSAWAVTAARGIDRMATGWTLSAIALRACSSPRWCLPPLAPPVRVPRQRRSCSSWPA